MLVSGKALCSIPESNKRLYSSDISIKKRNIGQRTPEKINNISCSLISSRFSSNVSTLILKRLVYSVLYGGGSYSGSWPKHNPHWPRSWGAPQDTG